MIGRQLTQRSAPDKIKPGITHMPHREPVFMRHRQREHAGHPAAFVAILSQAVDFVVGCRDRLPHSVGDVPLKASQFTRYDLDGSVRGQLARRPPSHTVNYQEDAGSVVDVNLVFIVLPLEARVAGSARTPSDGHSHWDQFLLVQWARTKPQANRKKSAMN